MKLKEEKRGKKIDSVFLKGVYGWYSIVSLKPLLINDIYWCIQISVCLGKKDVCHSFWQP